MGDYSAATDALVVDRLRGGRARAVLVRAAVLFRSDDASLDYYYLPRQLLADSLWG